MILRGGLLGVLALTATASAVTAATSEGSTPRWVMDPQTGCYIYHVDSRPADGASWSGTCVDRAAGGAGTAVFTQSGRFVESVSGTFARGVAQGVVRMNWADGAHFEGHAAAGRFSGQGMLTTAAGDRFDGEWSNAATGHGTILWANGERYEGPWKNDLPEGHGVLTRTDDSRIEGEFSGGILKPVQPPQVATHEQTKPLLASQMDLTDAPARTEVSPSSAPNVAPVRKSTAVSPWLADVTAQKLVAADGSLFRVTVAGNGVTMEVTSANGAVQKTDFRFLNGNQGTISVSQHPESVLGTFRVSDSALVAEYADGRDDRLWRDTSGALALSSALPDGRSFCTRWYAEGHQFSTAEREAALNEYARQLGVARKAGVSQDCVAATDEKGPAAARRRSHVPPAGTSKTALLAPLNTDEPIQVRTANVQLIDPVPGPNLAGIEPGPITAGIGARSSTGGLDRESAIWQANTGSRPDTAPQSCLSIEPENGSWGFRNACGYEVQFAYCVEGMASRPCDAKANSGSAPANAFAELFSEGEAGNAEYGLRWIVCKGASGEVEPRLIRAEPPVGECRKTHAGPVMLAAKMHAQ